MRKAKKGRAVSTVLDVVESADNAGLRYMMDDKAGIRRQRVGKGFKYLDAQGKVIRDPHEVKRIQSLAIPPAWTGVWICPLPHGHLQATGRDAKGRKQYRYHPEWREIRDQSKYERTLAFGRALPSIRRRVQRDLSRSGLPRTKVLATIVQLLEATWIRVGNKEYAHSNQSFGLTTLRNQHAQVKGDTLHFRFRGKGGKLHSIDLKNSRLAKIVRRCQDIPGYELFQYLDEHGQPQSIDSADVNAYLREISSQDFTAKDFRTWAGTVLAAFALQEFEMFDSKTQAKKNIVRAIERVAQELGNTPAICRKCYVHPEILNAYLDGSLLNALKKRTEQELSHRLHMHSPAEAAVLGILQQTLARQVKESE